MFYCAILMHDFLLTFLLILFEEAQRYSGVEMETQRKNAGGSVETEKEVKTDIAEDGSVC